MSNKLARVKWTMGQTLLPDHLIAQEDSILADSIKRQRLIGLPFYGIASLKFNDNLLSEGVLSVTKLTVIMRSGLLIDVPENAVVTPFNLNLSGKSSLSIYLHVLLTDYSDDDVSEDIDIDTEGVSRLYYKLVLSSEQSIPDVRERIKLVELEKNPEGLWSISKNYIPPLIQIGTNPFLKTELEQLDQTLELFQYNLTLDAASYLSGESLYSVKQCIKSVMHTKRLIANLKSQLHLHPYFLYEKLKVLYTDICFYRNINPENIFEPYDHDDLYRTFDLVLSPLFKQMQLVEKKQPYLAFEFKEGLYQVKLPEEIREASQVYFLVQKASVSQQVSLENLKLASASRIVYVHRMALKGIPIKKVERLPFQHSFGPEIEFYRIIEGEEWDYALNDRSIAFYRQESMDDMEFYIYWRMD